jgi:biotin operon repressor
MSSDKHHWFLKLDKDIFTKIKGDSSNVTAAFSLYMMLLFMMNHDNRVLTSPNILLQQTGKGFRQMELLRTNITALCESGLISKISTNSDKSTSCQLGKIKYNDTLEIYLAEMPKKNFITIRLVNEKIYRMLPKRKLDNAIAVYCYIKIFEVQNKSAIISQQKIANDLGIVENTVRVAINELKEWGLIYTSGGSYNPLKNKKECKRYKTYDADSLLDAKELSTWKEKLKKKELTLLGVKTDPVTLSIIQESEIRGNIKRILEKPEYCPALLIGQYALVFREMLTGKAEMILTEDGFIPSYPRPSFGKEYFFYNQKEIIEFIDIYASRIDDYCYIFFEKTLNQNTQSLLLDAIDNELKGIPLIFASNYDNIAFPFVSRMVSVFKQPIERITHFKNISLHDGYSNLTRYEKTNSAYKRGGKARRIYLSENIPKAYMMENMSGAWDLRMQRIDTTISKLTKGKTYLELL